MLAQLLSCRDAAHCELLRAGGLRARVLEGAAVLLGKLSGESSLLLFLHYVSQLQIGRARVRVRALLAVDVAREHGRGLLLRH